MAGTICQYYYTFGYLTMAGLAFLLNDSWQVQKKSLDAVVVIVAGFVVVVIVASFVVVVFVVFLLRESFLQ